VTLSRGGAGVLNWAFMQPTPATTPFSPRRNAPRAKGLPLLGALPDILRDPPAAFTRIAREHPRAVVRIPFGPAEAYLVTEPEHIQHVLQDNWRNYPKGASMWRPLRRLIGQGLVTADGELWIESRRRLQPFFTQKSIAAFAATMIDVIDRALQDLERRAGALVDIVREMTLITQNVIFETILGTRIDRDVANRLSAELAFTLRALNLRMMLYFLPERFPFPGEERLRRSTLAIDDVLMRLLREDEARGQSDGALLSLLRRAADPETGKRMSERQVRDELVTMWTAGNETTAMSLSWLWMLLDKHPEVEARARAEVREVLGGRLPTPDDLERMPYGKMVIREAMRHYPPSWLLPRQSIADDVVDGYFIPAGATVIVAQFATHRAPPLWERPEQFDPERFSPERSAGRHRFAYLPFGAGPRICIGMTFGMIELQLVLAMMLQRFRLHFTPGFQLRYESAGTLRPRGRVPVRLERVRV
jgi:cytochrome P450